MPSCDRSGTLGPSTRSGDGKIAASAAGNAPDLGDSAPPDLWVNPIESPARPSSGGCWRTALASASLKLKQGFPIPDAIAALLLVLADISTHQPVTQGQADVDRARDYDLIRSFLI